MLTLYVDADACPVKDEVYRVARRYELRQGGAITGGPAPMTAKDRSRFLSKLDEMMNAVRRAYPPRP